MQRGFSDLVVDRCVLIVERVRSLRCDDSESASIGILTPEVVTTDLDDALVVERGRLSDCCIFTLLGSVIICNIRERSCCSQVLERSCMKGTTDGESEKGAGGLRTVAGATGTVPRPSAPLTEKQAGWEN